MNHRTFILTAATVALAACSTPGTQSGAERAASEPAAAPMLGEWGVELQQRDLSVAPGDDFDAYANGTWNATHEMPADLSRYGMFTRVSLEAEHRIHAIVEELGATQARPGTLEQKVGDYYRSWMNTQRLDELGKTPLAPYLDAIYAIESPDDLSQAYASLHGDAPFSVGIMPDPADTTRYVAFVGQSGLGMPDRDYYLSQGERFDRYRAGYTRYVTQMFALAGIDRPAERAEAVIALESRLAEFHWTTQASRDIRKVYNPMSAGQLAELAPEFNWAAIFEQLGLGDTDTFVVAQTTAIADAGVLFADTDLDTIKDYLAFHCINAQSGNLSSAFDDARFAFFGRILRGTEQQRERWKRGVQRVSAGLGEAVGQIYVQRHFPSSHKANIDELVANLIEAFAERLEANEWMDEATREQALLKLSAFEPRIGYTEQWTDFGPLKISADSLVGNAMAITEFQWREQLERLGGPVDRAVWPYPPQTVNASYNPLLNQITFPAGILQPPFFDPLADPAVNYGAIGAVIGHEIGHGFDDQGRRFDETGRIRDWWTPTADKRFQKKTDALRAQYESYEPVDGETINGQLTMGENIGDLGGLQVAYSAYHRYLDECCNGVAEELDGYSGDQRFFMGWAQVWRSMAREDEVRRRLVVDPHSPPKYRINGVVRNLDAWYAAFDVTPDHALYLPPDERVRIW